MQHNEKELENHCLMWFQQLGWEYLHGDYLLPAEDQTERENLQEVVLKGRLQAAIQRLNPQLPEVAVLDVVNTLCRFDHAALVERNQRFHQFLREGVAVKYQQAGQEKFVKARLVDFENEENNQFLVVNQFKLKSKKGHRIPDVVCFLNGLPIAVLELKNPFADNVDIVDAYHQLQTYKNEIAELFVFNEALIISNGVQARIGSLTANFERFMPWRTVLNENDRPTFEWELETLVRGFFNPTLLLDYLRFFVQFEEDNGCLIKKIAAYHQFHAVREAVRCTVTASGLHGVAEPRATYGHQVVEGSKKAGVVWHTQGSGKSMSMLCYTAKLLAQPEMQNPTVVVVTDRNDLDGQLFKTFAKGTALLGQIPVQADSRSELRAELAKRDAGGIIFTTIQKFGLQEDEISHLLLNERHNIVVVSDEAHRTQYGFQGKYDDKGVMKFGYAKYLRDALPNACFIGFTGTPISFEDKDTRAVFGDYVSIYDIKDAVEDGATVPIYYEPRLLRLEMSHQVDEVLDEMEEELEGDEESQEKTKAAIMRMEAVLGTEQRIQAIAEDIIQHFEQRNQIMDGKGMIVALSRALCVKLYNAIIALRPEWHSLNANEGMIKVIMTSSASDPEDWQQHNYSKEDSKTIEKRFKDPADPLKLVIVRDMWLTGFDVPCLHTMYVDKPMKGHNLMQAIARVNRVYPTKSKENGGLIVSYLPLDKELEQAMQTYTNANGRGTITTDADQVLTKLQELLGQIEEIFATPVASETGKPKVRCDLTEFEQNPLKAMQRACEHILALGVQDQARIEEEKGHAKANGRVHKPRRNIKLVFCDYALSALRAYGLCSTLPEAKQYREKVAFFNAVKALVSKQRRKDSPKKEREELKLMLNNAVIPNGIADIFSLTGVKMDKVEVSLLSDTFLQSMKDTDYPHSGANTLESLLNNEIRSKLAQNGTKQRSFRERLEAILDRYNRSIDSVRDVINALIHLAEELKQAIAKGVELGLTEQEVAFYDALCCNKSAEELLGEKVLVELSRELIHLLKREVSIDWQYREAVKAKLRLYVKRLLKKYKYPPDNQQQAIELVLQQAELSAEYLIKAS